MILAVGFLGLQSETWAGVGLGAVASALIAVLVARMQRKTKHLDYRVINEVLLGARGLKSIDHDVAVLYKGEEITDPHLVTIRLENSGNTEVRPEDFADYIRISVAGSIKDVVLIDSHPKDLFSNIFDESHWAERKLFLKPGLMNRHDWFDLQLILSGPPGRIKVSSRIVGVSRSMREVGLAASLSPATLLLALFGLPAVLIGLLTLLLALALQNDVPTYATLALLFLSTLVTGAGIAMAAQGLRRVAREAHGVELFSHREHGRG